MIQAKPGHSEAEIVRDGGHRDHHRRHVELRQEAAGAKRERDKERMPLSDAFV